MQSFLYHAIHIIKFRIFVYMHDEIISVMFTSYMDTNH